MPTETEVFLQRTSPELRNALTKYRGGLSVMIVYGSDQLEAAGRVPEDVKAKWIEQITEILNNAGFTIRPEHAGTPVGTAKFLRTVQIIKLNGTPDQIRKVIANMPYFIGAMTDFPMLLIE